MFGGKKPNREYIYTDVGLQKVKIWIEELYLPMYQVDKLPIDCFIPESFVRAIQSEVYRRFSMNWACFVEE